MNWGRREVPHHPRRSHARIRRRLVGDRFTAVTSDRRTSDRAGDAIAAGYAHRDPHQHRTEDSDMPEVVYTGSHGHIDADGHRFTHDHEHTVNHALKYNDAHPNANANANGDAKPDALTHRIRRRTGSNYKRGQHA